MPLQMSMLKRLVSLGSPHPLVSMMRLKTAIPLVILRTCTKYTTAEDE